MLNSEQSLIIKTVTDRKRYVRMRKGIEEDEEMKDRKEEGKKKVGREIQIKIRKKIGQI